MQTTNMFTWIYSHLLRGPAATKYTEQLSLWIFGWTAMNSLGHDWRVSTILLLKKTWGLSFLKFFCIETPGKWRFSVFPLLNLPSHWVSIVIASSWVLRKDSPAGKYTQSFSRKGQDSGAASYQWSSKRLSMIIHVLLHLLTKVKTGELVDTRSWDLYIITGNTEMGSMLHACMSVLRFPLKSKELH